MPDARQLINDRDIDNLPTDTLVPVAEELLKLDGHPGFKALVAILEQRATVTTDEFLECDLSTPEGIEEMKILQNRVARPYWILESIENVLRQVADLDAAEEAAPE